MNDDDVIWVEAESLEALKQDVFEVMEESFPEFVWNGELIISTKYRGEEDENSQE